MVSHGTIRAVNPQDLAHASSVTKIPGFASTPIPPVIRPNLLTGQLAGFLGCPNCGDSHAGPAGYTGLAGLATYIPPDYGHLRGLGFDGEYGLFKMFSSGMGPSIYPNLPGVTTTTGSTPTSPTSSATPVTSASMAGLRALGQATQTSSTATDVQNFMNSVNSILKAFRPGASEADAIVGKGNTGPQGQLMTILGNITNQFLVGSNPSLSTLQALFTQAWAAAVAFGEFVVSKQFTDRRASGQALNTVMPFVDGTAGYPVPLPPNAPWLPTNPPNAGMQWGSGSIGGTGNNGILGALARAIGNAGGGVPITTSVQAAVNSGMAVPALTSAAPGYVAPGMVGTTILPGLTTTTLIGGLSLTTWILIALGFVVIMRVGKR
jgi:hypothetical protein